MKKIGELFIKILIIIFIALMLGIVFMAITNYEVILFKFNSIVLILGIIGYLILIRLAYNKLIPKIENNKYIPYILMGVFTILCLTISMILRVNPSWDMGTVFNIAVDFANTGHIDSNYLYQFPNNIMISLIYCVLFKIMSIIKITNYITVATIFNSLVVSATVFLTYQISKRIFDNKKALMFLIIALFTTPLYLYGAIYYTDTLSMLMVAMIVYFYILLQDINKESKVTKIFLSILLGVLLVVAIKVKITSIFIVLGYLVYIILSGQIKKVIKFETLIVVATMIIISSLYGLVVNKKIINNDELNNSLKIPITNWIMIGLKGTGVYNDEDYSYIYKYPTYEEKKKASVEKIKERLSDYNVNTFYKHIKSKLNYAWADGTYFAPEKLRRQPVNENLLHEFVLTGGKYSGYYKYIPQVMHISMIILIIINSISIIRKRDYKNVNIAFIITTLGFITFLLIWENRSRYILTNVPVMMMMQLDGIEIISKLKRKRIKK